MQVRIELYDVQRTKWVHNAHSSPLACMALSLNGKLLATASERGTLVRIHATQDGTRLQVTSHLCDPWGNMLQNGSSMVCIHNGTTFLRTG